MKVQSDGWFRTRVHDDGSVEVWARGWRVEAVSLPLLPAVLAVSFLYASAPLAIRVVGCLALFGAGVACLRLTKLGVSIGPRGLEVRNVVRTGLVPWEDFVGFVGERTAHDGRVLLVRKDGSTLTLAGSLNGEEMNPIGDEGDLSAIDQLNRLAERVRVRTGASRAAPTPRERQATAPDPGPEVTFVLEEPERPDDVEPEPLVHLTSDPSVDLYPTPIEPRPLVGSLLHRIQPLSPLPGADASPGARRLAAFLDSLPPDEPEPEPERRGLLGRRRRRDD